MKNDHRRVKANFRWMFILPVIILAGLLIPAWLLTGYVECRGVIEPANWVPLYALSDGQVVSGGLTDGTLLRKGETVLVTDTAFIGWNIERVSGETNALKAEITYLKTMCELFSRHRDIEAAELQRLMEADRLLEASSSVSKNELLHSIFLYESFLAGSDREETDLLQTLERDRASLKLLESEMLLWEDRLEDCRILSPADGTFYTADSIFNADGIFFLPPVGPGRRIETGQLLGYVVPEGGIRIRIRLPQEHAGDCEAGHNVRIIPDARPGRYYPPLEGKLVSLSAIASGGFVPGEVLLSELEYSGNADVLLCGTLTARVDIKKPQSNRFLVRIWEQWVFLVNPF